MAGVRSNCLFRLREAVSFGQSFFIYLALIPILLYRTPEINRSRLVKFSIYQLLLGVILLNPLLHPLFLKLVPSDGFWRIYYLFQYPTVVVILAAITLNFIKIGSYKKALIPGIFLSCWLLLEEAYYRFKSSGATLIILKGCLQRNFLK